MAQKPSIPKGTRDFSPLEMGRRNYIFDTIKSTFQMYGYQPIQTPAMENLSTLLGKSGEEADRLLFKVLNSGDFLKGVDAKDVTEGNTNKVISKISEKGLRYDLTVPFARYVVQHRNDITFPFKRYQIQPVWRADRPQKGRYREFYQCDVDVIGSNSLMNEVEMVRMIDDIFGKLNINVIIKVNNRKVLSGIAELIDEPGQLTNITTAIDKLDKIGVDNVIEELKQRGLPKNKIEQVMPVIQLSGSNQEKINRLKDLIGETGDGSAGLAELQNMLDYLKNLNISSDIEIDPSLARGLSYYTGAIIEVKAKDVQIGSICGGGRYDNLTGIFGLPDVSGVGVSFGADRIFDVLNELNLFPEQAQKNKHVLLVNFGDEEAAFCLKISEVLYKYGIGAEVYPEPAKMKKQMQYADRKDINFVLLIGEEEINSGQYTLKDMKTGTQIKGVLTELIKRIKT